MTVEIERKLTNRIPQQISGFTVIELLVCVAVVAVLLALLVPAIQSARESAWRLTCNSRIRQLALAAHNYSEVHRVFPPGSQVIVPSQPQYYTKSFGWTVALLPFIDGKNLYERFNFDLDCQIHQRDLTKQQVKAFVCPSDPLSKHPLEWQAPGGVHPVWGAYFEGGWGTTNYMGNSGVGGMLPKGSSGDCGEYADGPKPLVHSGIFFGNSSVSPGDISDGASNTAMFVERGVVDSWGKWGGAGDITKCPAGILDVTIPTVLGVEVGGGLRPRRESPSDRFFLWSWHSVGTHFALADGSVRFTSFGMDHKVQTSLATRNGGETVSEW